MLYICTKFHENILDGNKVIEQTRFILEIFQWAIISQNNLGAVTVIVYCTLSDTCSIKISLLVFKL